jgi:asparagine synthase (glutamine-hydrolysing)
MCGIVGYINKNGRPAELQLTNEMTKALSHRGPHGEGVHIFKNVAIGHRRLAIIDLETGTQPMSNEDDTIWITYNGELYNYRELRTILINKGHRFKTNSDTEVIIHAYEEYGKTCVEYFQGMFAFVILDMNRSELFIARDHIGIKPLAFLNDNNYFAFSSELQAFHLLPEFKSELNINAIDEYMLLHYIPPPHTIYQDTYKLPPAHRMAVDLNGNIKYYESYWDLSFAADNKKNEEEWLEELDHLLRDSIKKHLIADVPVGAFLSGGIDSTIIVKYMSELQGTNIPKTFSIGFDDELYSEVQYSDMVRIKYNTEHYSEIVSHDMVDILPKLIQHYGEPFGDDSCIPTYYLSNIASRKVNVVLSGDGGDEFFGGYIAYERWINLTKGEFSKYYKNYPLWKKMVYPIFHHIFTSRYPHKYYVRYDLSTDNWIKHVQSTDIFWRNKLWKDDFKQNIQDVPEIFRNLSKYLVDLTPVQMAQYMDIKTTLPAVLLPKVDIASMMNGLEVRTPLTNKEVAEFICKIPDKYKMYGNNRGNYTGKYLLKKLLRKDFSDDFIFRRKMGFTPPTRTWFGENGKKRNFIREQLLDSNSNILDFFHRDSVLKLFHKNKLKELWLLLVLEIWLENVHKPNKDSKKSSGVS